MLMYKSVIFNYRQNNGRNHEQNEEQKFEYGKVENNAGEINTACNGNMASRSTDNIIHYDDMIYDKSKLRK